jgi:predicted peptidase
LYLHGDSGWSKGALSNSLPKLLKDGTLNVPGIVVIPESNSAAWWDDKKGADKNREAAVELTKKIASDYQCDTTRISACGHSNGGCGVFHMVRDHTDLFSCYIASAGATGKNAGNEKIAEGKVYTWVIHGDKDTVVEYDNNHGTSGKETYERIEQVWPEGTSMTTLKGKDHYYQNDLWTMTLDKDGEQVNPMEWLLTTKKYGT